MRMEKPFFEITFMSDGSGPIKHRISAPSLELAIKRLEMAYPDQRLSIVKTGTFIRIRDTTSAGPKRVRASPKR